MRLAPAPRAAKTDDDEQEWTQRIVLVHVYFGEVEKSSFYFDYVLESMRTNEKNVEFVIANVRDNPEDANKFIKHVGK